MTDDALIPNLLLDASNSDNKKKIEEGSQSSLTAPEESVESRPKREEEDTLQLDKQTHKQTLFEDDDLDDSASVLVIILQCETKACDNNISNLKWIFSDPYFTVQVCAVDPPDIIPPSKTLASSQYLESHDMRKVLTYAAEGPYITNSHGITEPQYWWENLPVIIIKDSSIVNFSPWQGFDDLTAEEAIVSGMKRRISVALERARQADIFFLCKWNDACDKYIDVDGSMRGSSLKWSTQPTATQAIMYRPHCRDAVRASLTNSNIPMGDMLNTSIARGDLLATVFVPNIIDYDIDLATSNDDYAKLNECAPPEATNNTSNNVAALVWLILIVIMVVLVAWALIQLNPTTTPT